MHNSTQNMTSSQLREWYETTILTEAKNNGLHIEPDSHTKQSRLNHDLWSLYDYGDIIRVVYLKNIPSDKNPRNDPLFPETVKPKPKYEKHPRPEGDRFKNSLSRTRSRIFELAMCNEFTHFCTFTQNEKMRDRFDLGEFRKDLAQLVRNINRNKPDDGKIKYLLLPEKHKNGAWHMHGLFMGFTDDDLREFTLKERLPEKIRKAISSGHSVYNWERYSRKFGFFTCTKIENHTACAKYITKYITKELGDTYRDSGGHLFFASQGLKGRETVVKKSGEKCPVVDWDFENDYVKICDIPKNDITLFKTKVSNK